jgi:DNA repair protein RecN (Recombination protein N)
MLLELAIRDFAIIDETRIPFREGFNALTGETGAGKSILIDALGAVLGERVSADMVRTGAKAARVEATFDVASELGRPEVAAVLDEFGVEPEDGVLIFSREIAAGGRGGARINGRAVTAGTLARIGSLLVDIHGQSDHLSLLRPAEHLEMLDRFAALVEERQALGAVVADLRSVQTSIADVTANARERAQRVDLLRFQVDEITSSNLRSGEEEALTEERAVLANAERLAEDATVAWALITGGDDLPEPGALPASQALRQASQRVSDIAQLDTGARDLSERLDEVVYLLEDIAAEIRDYGDRAEANPDRLAAIEERLDDLKALKRKYGSTVEEIIRFGEDAAAELAAFEGEGGDVDALREREARLREEAGQLASELSEKRVTAGESLARAVEDAISELAMGRSAFAVRVTQVDDPEGVPFTDGGPPRTVAVDATGADRVEFLLAPNAGEALKPLGRVASGGETARLMLALKSILSEADSTPSLVFDEVDVGVGGRSAQVVGEKLWDLSRGHQVLVITHHTQIAAFAETHFRIEKRMEGERIVSRVGELEGAERIEELAEMIDGNPPTEESRANARAVLERVSGWKRARGG